MMSPNTGPARNEWSAMWELEVPKIGIGIKDHFATGWATIIPRTFGYSVGSSLVPLYDDGGYDVLFVGYGWGLDWNPQGLYDSSGSHKDGGGGNFYNFDLTPAQEADPSLTSDVEELVTDYLSTLDFTTRLEIVSDLQHELYNHIPAIPILYPQSHWGFRDNIYDIDPILISVSALEWEDVLMSDNLRTTFPVYNDPPTTSFYTENPETSSNSVIISTSDISTETDDLTSDLFSNTSEVDFSNILTETTTETDVENSESVSFTSTGFSADFQLPIVLLAIGTIIHVQFRKIKKR